MIDLRIVGRTALVTGLGGLGATLVAAFVTFPAHEVNADVVLRIVLVTCVLLFLLPVFLRDAYPGRRSLGSVSVMGGAICGYALDLASWNGRAYAGQLLHSPGAVTIALDLVLWLVVVGVAVQWRMAVPRPRRTTSSYLG